MDRSMVMGLLPEIDLPINAVYPRPAVMKCFSRVMGIEHMNHTEMRLRGQEKCSCGDTTRLENREKAERQKQTPMGVPVRDQDQGAC